MLLFSIAGGKNALEYLKSAFKCPEWKWDITFTSVHRPELTTWPHSTTKRPKSAIPLYVVKAKSQKYFMSSANVYILFVSLIDTVVITKYYTHMENMVLNNTLWISPFLLPYLASLLLSHSDVYTHLDLPGLWGSP